MTILMLLAFLIDQVQFLCCRLRKKLKEKLGTWRDVFARIRFMFESIIWDKWLEFYESILDPETHPPPNWFGMPISVDR